MSCPWTLPHRVSLFFSLLSLLFLSFLSPIHPHFLCSSSPFILSSLSPSPLFFLAVLPGCHSGDQLCSCYDVQPESSSASQPWMKTIRQNKFFLFLGGYSQLCCHSDTKLALGVSRVSQANHH